MLVKVMLWCFFWHHTSKMPMVQLLKVWKVRGRPCLLKLSPMSGEIELFNIFCLAITHSDPITWHLWRLSLLPGLQLCQLHLLAGWDLLLRSRHLKHSNCTKCTNICETALYKVLKYVSIEFQFALTRNTFWRSPNYFPKPALLLDNFCHFWQRHMLIFLCCLKLSEDDNIASRSWP